MKDFYFQMKTYHIHVIGQVQGVGFRPFVYRLAQLQRINGMVFNGIDGVHIFFNSIETEAAEFYQTLLNSAPSISNITSSFFLETTTQIFNDFRIVSSDYVGQHSVLLTPDFAMCSDCHKELIGEIGTNRRTGYPFITCTVCGPRYSIYHRLPFDRENTSMDNFEMCSSCKNEYEMPTDRRYYSQTNSCPECGISLWLDQKELDGKDYRTIVEESIQLLEQGKIIAVKGIGGYLLICDATNKESINKLRGYKQRPSKPFALMYPTLEMLRVDVMLRPLEEETLMSPSSPILLLQLKENPSSKICFSEIAPGLSQVGAILPYAPVYALLLSTYNKPVVATSANSSNSPIIYDDINDTSQLGILADHIISNNRKIIVPQDDSVVKFSSYTSQKIVLRRSRGMAPTYINPELSMPSENILATGALLKNTFTLTHQQNIYISQYLGDLDNYDVQNNYHQCIKHFYSLLDTRPEVILTDKHPDYYSTSYGVNFSEELNVPVKRYQHHMAHFAAVLGENNLITNDKPVLGVIWDGVGLGDDGQIWGGEFFIYKNYEFERCDHFGYFDYLFGDKMGREPRISALSVTAGLDGAEAVMRKKFSNTEWSNYQKILEKNGNPQTSSVGRLFDAVASLLDLTDISSYEGEAAMYLEKLASDYFRKNGLTMSETYFDEKNNSIGISTRNMVEKLIFDLKKGKDKGFIAAKFHYSFVTLVRKIATRLNIKNIAFSGGVFQNELLIDLIRNQMTTDFNVYFHRQLSSNDENISFGQLCCYCIEQQRLKSQSSKNTKYVLSYSR